MTSLNTDAPKIYHPAYDIHTGNYVDCCPILPRHKEKYVCYCSSEQKIFNNKSEFSYHIKLKCHRIYISNYNERINDFGSAKDYIKNLLVRNGNLEKEVAQLKYQLAQLTRQSVPDPMVDLD